MDVLIIDPSKSLAMVIAEALARKELSSAIAHSAQKGIELADKNIPKVVILEPLIYLHNGIEFIYEFRSYSEWLDVPIILYTNLSQSELKFTNEMKQDLGVVDHLYKPTNTLQKLISKVEDVI